MEELAKNRLFMAVAGVSTAIASLTLLLPSGKEPHRMLELALSSSHILIMALMGFLLHIGGNRRVLTLYLLGWVMLASSIHLSIQDSIFTSYYAWPPLLVILAAFLLDLRAAAGTAILFLLQLLIFIFNKRGEFGPFPIIPARELYYATLVATILAAEILMGFFAFSFEYLREHTEANLLKQRVAATRLARLVEIGELFQSIHRNFEPELGALDLTLTRLQALPQQPAITPNDCRHQLRRLQGTLTTMSDLLKSLQDHAIAGDEPLRFIPILELFQSLHKEVQNEFRLHRVQIRFADHTQNEPIFGRINQIMQVLRALLTNSMEALEALEIRRITLESSVTDDQLIIAVRDNGPGVPREWRDKIWQPFFSGKASNYARGLGLTLGANIMEEHGGTLALEAHPHETCFLMKFPRAKEVSRAAHI